MIEPLNRANCCVKLYPTNCVSRVTRSGLWARTNRSLWLETEVSLPLKGHLIYRIPWSDHPGVISSLEPIMGIMEGQRGSEPPRDPAHIQRDTSRSRWASKHNNKTTKRQSNATTTTRPHVPSRCTGAEVWMARQFGYSAPGKCVWVWGCGQGVVNMESSEVISAFP